MEKNTSITNKKQQTNKLLFKIFYINIISQENVFFLSYEIWLNLNFGKLRENFVHKQKNNFIQQFFSQSSHLPDLGEYQDTCVCFPLNANNANYAGHHGTLQHGRRR